MKKQPTNIPQELLQNYSDEQLHAIHKFIQHKCDELELESTLENPTRQPTLSDNDIQHLYTTVDNIQSELSTKDKHPNPANLLKGRKLMVITSELRKLLQEGVADSTELINTELTTSSLSESKQTTTQNTPTLQQLLLNRLAKRRQDLHEYDSDDEDWGDTPSESEKKVVESETKQSKDTTAHTTKAIKDDPLSRMIASQPFGALKLILQSKTTLDLSKAAETEPVQAPVKAIIPSTPPQSSLAVVPPIKSFASQPISSLPAFNEEEEEAAESASAKINHREHLKRIALIRDMIAEYSADQTKIPPAGPTDSLSPEEVTALNDVLIAVKSTLSAFTQAEDRELELDAQEVVEQAKINDFLSAVASEGYNSNHETLTIDERYYRAIQANRRDRNLPIKSAQRESTTGRTLRFADSAFVAPIKNKETTKSLLESTESEQLRALRAPYALLLSAYGAPTATGTLLSADAPLLDYEDRSQITEIEYTKMLDVVDAWLAHDFETRLTSTPEFKATFVDSLMHFMVAAE
ncbi:MAG: hypothetical protein V4490_01055, partial [Pseudomonadota bacterium]